MAEPVNPAFFDSSAEDAADYAPSGRWKRPAALLLCGGSALVWLGLSAWQAWSALSGRAAGLADFTGFVGSAAAPLALAGVGWLLLQRSSRAEADRFEQTRRAMERESQRLEAVMAFVSARIDSARAELAAQGDTLCTLGDEAASRITGSSAAIGKEIVQITSHAETLKAQAAATRGDLTVLLAQLPKTQVQLRNIALTLHEAADISINGTKALSSDIVALGLKSQEAKGLASEAGELITVQLQGMSQVAGRLQAMMAESQQALAASGDAATGELEARVRAIGGEIDRIGSALLEHDRVGSALLDSLGQGVAHVQHHLATMESDVSERAARIGRAIADRVSDGVNQADTRLVSLEASLGDRSERLSLALGALRNHADDLKLALEGGADAANGLTEKTQSLLTALEAAAREIDETIPAAYARLEEGAGRAMASAQAVEPLVVSLAGTSAEMSARVADADRTLAAQKAALETMAASADAQLAACQQQAEELVSLMAKANVEAEGLSKSAGTDLLDVLSRTRETAQQVAQQTRAALASLVPDTALELGRKSREMLSVALSEEIETQLAGMEETIQRSIKAARTNMTQLDGTLRQMGQTSAALEARIEAAQDESDRRDHTHFARRVALLIESLNSIAIDVTKLLSNEVTDAAWASYMRGDRGVFARRAVKLLDNAEAREIARHYQDDPEFREQVNRYVHDYEAMLRNVMATREGTPLSVALLSADTGKLYVALAQAIERLRS